MPWESQACSWVRSHVKEVFWEVISVRDCRRRSDWAVDEAIDLNCLDRQLINVSIVHALHACSVAESVCADTREVCGISYDGQHTVSIAYVIEECCAVLILPAKLQRN